MCDISFSFISSSQTSRQKLFSEFFYSQAREDSGGGIFISEKVVRDLKSNISGLYKIFCFESWDRF